MSDWQNNNKNQIQIILIYPEDIIHLFLDFGDKIHFSLLSCQNIHNQILISSLVIPCYHKYSHNQFTVRVSIWILSGGFMVLLQHGPQIFQGSSFDDHIVYWPLTLLWLTGEFLLWNRVARQGDRMHILGYTMTTVPLKLLGHHPQWQVV